MEENKIEQLESLIAGLYTKLMAIEKNTAKMADALELYGNFKMKQMCKEWGITDQAECMKFAVGQG